MFAENGVVLVGGVWVLTLENGACWGAEGNGEVVFLT